MRYGWVLLCLFIGLVFVSWNPLTVTGSPKDSPGSGQIQIFDAKLGKVVTVDKVSKPDSEWKKLLTSMQFYVTRKAGTEVPFTGKYDHFFKKGVYKCVCCGTDLYRSDTKFDSGTGWPSFWAPISTLNVLLKDDDSLGMHRTEVLCSRCGAHLGHVFDDGPAPTHKRFCMNSAALVFVPK